MKIKILKIRLSEMFQEKDEILVNDYLKNYQILQMTSQLISEKEIYWSIFIGYSEKNAFVNEPKAVKYSVEVDEELNSDELKILESLKLWRTEKAKDQNLPVYFVATNKELFSIAKFKPLKKEELQEIKGFGKFKIEHYGTEIIEILEQV